MKYCNLVWLDPALRSQCRASHLGRDRKNVWFVNTPRDDTLVSPQGSTVSIPSKNSPSIYIFNPAQRGGQNADLEILVKLQSSIDRFTNIRIERTNQHLTDGA